MPTQVVPIIYRRVSKEILRWYLLDYEHQLQSSAFGPQGEEEGVVSIPLSTYKSLAGSDARKPLLHKLQSYVNTYAP